MQDLTLVGLTEDRTRLVLVSDSGEEYTLAADAKLRAALRGDLARHGQLEKRMESALRPRDIQARIRSGESPESVADAAQTTVDRIMSYATPVLAERAHIADRALRASLRRRGGEGAARMLGDAVAEHLRSRNVDPETVDWDSWRREDGRWTVVATFANDGRTRRGEFIFDVQGRYVVAEDDAARWLVGEQQAPRLQQPAGPRRLSAVSREQQLPLGDDAIEMVTAGEPGAEDTAQDGPEERTGDLTHSAREARGSTPPRVDELVTPGDADWMATQASDRPRPPLREARPQPPRPSTSEQAPERPEPAQARTPDKEPESTEGEEAEEHSEPAQKKPARKGRRASVPSWDEIMFGGGRSE